MSGIVNEQAILDVYGKWPSFHDAEVLSIALGRGVDGWPFLEAVFYLFEMTNEIDNQGYYVLRNHRIVCLRFEEISGLEIEDFDSQNVLFDLRIDHLEPSENNDAAHEICFNASIGTEASFRCRRIEVKSVEPYTPAD